MRRALPLILCLLFAGIALARDIAVSTDAELAAALGDARPGDTIALAPGVYTGGIRVTLAGEKHNPIVIASADAGNMAIVEGSSGLQLSGARYVTLRNLVVRKSSRNGINIDDAGRMDQSAVGIRVESCHVLDTGPKDNLDGIKLSGVRDFAIVDSLVSGWGGSAIDMVGCADGAVTGTRLIGKPGFDQSSGIQTKGGTRNVRIARNRFEDAGTQALNIGGATGLAYFRPLDATYEAKDITVEHNLIRGSESPVAFDSVDGAVFAHNTIVDPGKQVMEILQASRDQRFARCGNVRFEKNLIVYTHKQVRTFARIGPDTAPQTFVFANNWWWCSDGPTRKPDLPTPEADGVYGEDPQLDDDAMPQNPAARDYGAARQVM